MIREAKLNTLHMYDNYDKNYKDYPLWKKIAEYMNGEIAFVLEKSFEESSKYLFLGLKDDEKNKKLHYMIEQDSMIGCFINDRKGFDNIWDNENYEPDTCFYIEAEYLVFGKSEESKCMNS